MFLPLLLLLPFSLSLRPAPRHPSLRSQRLYETNDVTSKGREEEVRERIRRARETYIGSEEDALALNEAFVDSLKTKRSYVSILVERFMQSLDDGAVARRMKKKENKGDMSSNKEGMRRERIVVLGSGWGAHSFLKTIDASLYEVIVVSPRNYFLFTPMLAASAVGTVEFRSIIEPIRNVNPLADFLEVSLLISSCLSYSNRSI